MRNFPFLAAAACAVVSVVSAQDANITASLTVAATTVAPSVSSAPTLFPVETVQLTDEVLADVAATLQNDTIASLFAFGNSTNSTLAKRTRSCKIMADDIAWPVSLIWDILDILLGGRLIKTVPLAAPCYKGWPQYDASKCNAVTENWIHSELHMADPSSIMYPLYEGRSCMAPGFNYTSTCQMGGYPAYVVNVSSVAQIQLAVNFARNLNIRLVVKNTGHDFNGKASGKGALSIWTHYLKDKAYFPNFKADNGYVGPAIKIGSGVQVFEAYEYAKSLGVTVVGGEAVTVGMGGGYIAGGGHSPLSSLYGIAADHVVAMEVVLADGSFVTATAKQNPDVYWMLRGGGGSTIGVVTSLTVKAYPKLPTTAVSFSFTTADCPGPEQFWAAIHSYIDNAQSFVNAGTYGYYFLIPLAPGFNLFQIQSFVAPNMTIAQTKALLAPWFNKLDSLNITYTPTYNYADNFHDAWVPGFPEESVGTDIVKTASRLLPRSVFQDDSLRNQTYLAFRDALDNNGLFVIGFHITGKGIAVTPPTDNAVLPAWRNATMHVIVGKQWTATTSWADIKDQSLYVTSWMDKLRTIAPNSGAYMSEADVIEPNLTQAFYGANYPRLYALKQRYDPTGVFYALTAVGAEDWEIQVTDPVPYSWNTNGRLCPK